MPLEIERKFLISNNAWQSHIHKQASFRQGYLTSNERISIRVRISENAAWLNIKSGTLGISREEYEYPIPLPEAEEMLRQLCLQPVIEKIRYWVNYQGFTWEIDVFAGDNAGLVVAEIELPSEETRFAMPDWIGTEVSQHLRYYNSRLMGYPFCQWTHDEKNPV